MNIEFLLLVSFSNPLKQLNELGKTYLIEELQILADNQFVLEKSIPQPPPNMWDWCPFMFLHKAPILIQFLG